MPLVVISLIWSPFLHALAAHCASVFGYFTEIEKTLFWPSLHVSLRVLHCLRHPSYTLCCISLLIPIFAWFVSLSCFCFWTFYRTGNSLILAHSSCFIKGLSWFEASFIHFMLYLSFGPHFCIAFWTCFHTVLGPSINCKMLYFLPLFNIVEGPLCV